MRKEHHDGLWAGILFLLLTVRTCSVGLKYWPQADDYIQYHNYLEFGDFLTVAKVKGVLSFRPLAGTFDYFVWGPMWNCMIVGAILIALCYVIYILLSVRLLRRYFSVSPLCPVIMALLPSSLEGVYWMSGSTRIVMGLLTGSIAVACLIKWLDTHHVPWLLGYLLIQLLTFGFYEEPAILSVAMGLGVAILEWRRHKARGLIALWGFPCILIYFLYQKLMEGMNPYAGRNGIMLPVSDYYFKTFLPNLLGQVRDVYFHGTMATLFRGFRRALGMIFHGQVYLWVPVFMVILSVIFGILTAWKPLNIRRLSALRSLLALAAGFLLALAPISILFFLSSSAISFRTIVPSLLGIALIFDTILQLLCQFLKHPDRGTATVAAALALVMAVAGISEMADYKATYEEDQKGAQAILDALSQDYPDEASCEGVRVGILGLDETFLPEQNYLYHGHIVGCLGRDWALSGLLTCTDGTAAVPKIEPLPTGAMYGAWNAETRQLSGFDRVYWYDRENGEVRPVTIEQTGDRDYLVYDGDLLLGQVWCDENQNGYFSRSPAA